VLADARAASLVVTPKVRVQGRLELPGRPRPPHPRWVVPVTVQLHAANGSGPLHTFALSTGEDGTFQLPPVEPGTYRVLVQVPYALPRVLTAEFAPGSPTLEVGPLKFGDIVADRAVDIRDFSALSAQFGRCGERLSADLNGDGCVEIRDFSLLAESFGQVGDTVDGR